MTDYLTWFLVAFFIIGTRTNGLGPQKIRESYAAWGYPAWFRFVTAALEALVAALLLFPLSQPFGIVLGVMIMLAAAATLIRAKDYVQLSGPVVIIALLLVLAYLSAAT